VDFSLAPAGSVAERTKTDSGHPSCEAWAEGGYHGFCADGGIWSAISSAGEVLTGGTPEALDRAIQAHWQAMQ
jgi:hypothetical protein